MEIFSHTYATAYGRSYAVTDEEYLQESLEPPNRLTTRELNQLRAIRQEIGSRPRLTRFEKRYVRLLTTAERKFSDINSVNINGILQMRQSLKEMERTTTECKRAITIAFLVAAIAKL
jgi:DNA anti-recombination protein RmuC